MGRSAFVYNPDDENDSGQFNGELYHLPAHSTLEILPYGGRIKDAKTQVASSWDQHKPGEIAAHLEAQLHKWGVRVVSGEIRDGKAGTKELQEEVDAADDAYYRATRVWAEERVLGYAARAKPYREAKLVDPEMTAEEETAAKWLDKHRGKFTAKEKGKPQGAPSVH